MGLAVATAAPQCLAALGRTPPAAGRSVVSEARPRLRGVYEVRTAGTARAVASRAHPAPAREGPGAAPRPEGAPGPLGGRELVAGGAGEVVPIPHPPQGPPLHGSEGPAVLHSPRAHAAGARGTGHALHRQMVRACAIARAAAQATGGVPGGLFPRPGGGPGSLAARSGHAAGPAAAAATTATAASATAAAGGATAAAAGRASPLAGAAPAPTSPIREPEGQVRRRHALPAAPSPGVRMVLGVEAQGVGLLRAAPRGALRAGRQRKKWRALALAAAAGAMQDWLSGPHRRPAPLPGGALPGARKRRLQPPPDGLAERRRCTRPPPLTGKRSREADDGTTAGAAATEDTETTERAWRLALGDGTASAARTCGEGGLPDEWAEPAPKRPRGTEMGGGGARVHAPSPPPPRVPRHAAPAVTVAAAVAVAAARAAEIARLAPAPTLVRGSARPCWYGSRQGRFRDPSHGGHGGRGRGRHKGPGPHGR